MPGEPFEYVAEFTGVLFVWPAWEPNEPVFVLHVARGKDDGDGGTRTPCILVAMKAREHVTIVVEGAGDGVELHLNAAPETEATRAAAATAYAELDEITAMREAGDLTGARKRIAACIDTLLACGGAQHSEDVSEAAWSCGFDADAMWMPEEVLRAWSATLVHRRRTMPADVPPVTWAQSNVANTLAALGQLPVARAMSEQVLALRERRLPEDHPDLAQARENLGCVLDRLDDFAGARALFERVVATYARTRPEDNPDLADARSNLAAMLYAQDDLAGARVLFERALATYVRSLPPDAARIATLRTNLAMTLRGLGDPEAARDLQEQVIATWQRILAEDDEVLVDARQELALTLRDLGETAAARDLEESALAARERTLPDHHEKLANVRGNLALTLKDLGEFARARALEERVVETRARTLPEGHVDLATARSNLANTLKLLGDFAGARELEEMALAALERTHSDDDPLLARMRSNFATTLHRLGDLAGARALQERALALFARTRSEDDPDLIGARSNLALTLNRLGDLAGARVLQEQVLAALARKLPESHPNVAVARLNLALTMKDLGDAAGARVLEEQVLAAFSRTIPDHPYVALLKSNLAATRKKLGDLAEARMLFEEALAILERARPEDHPDLIWTRASLAITLAREWADGARGDRRERFTALALANCRAIAHAATAAWLEGSAREVEERLGRASADFGRTLSLAEGLGTFPADAARTDAAFIASECTRGAAIVASALVRRAHDHPEYADARNAAAAARAEFARIGQAGAPRDVVERALARREAAEQALLAVVHEAGVGSAAAGDLSCGVIADALGADRAAIAFRRYRRWTVDAKEERSSADYCAFVLRPDATLVRVELGPAAPIEEAIETWRNGLGGGAGRGIAAGASRPDPRAVGTGETLRRLVWDPLLPAVGEALRVLVVADDVLHTVPFDALPLGEVLLGERVEIHLRLTLAELLWEEAEPRGSRTLVALGDAAFGDRDEAGRPFALRGGPWADGFDRLPATGSEARGICELFGEGSVVLDGAGADRDRLAAAAPEARFLHLATHGWFAPESIRSCEDPEVIDAALGVLGMSAEQRIVGSSPMVLCGLALTGANEPADALGRYPGLITAEEIAGWDLSNCELAVLSACETNVGLRRAGQGVASLQKALHLAGARSVITSLWRVPDEATKELMLDFYRRLWIEGKPKHRALWEAKMRLRDVKNAAGAPKYTTRDWAAWVLTGDPD